MSFQIGLRGPVNRRAVAAGAVLVAAGAVMSVVESAPAQAAWTAGWRVSPKGWTADDSPRVSVDRQGDALLVWRASDPKSSYYRIQVRRKPAGKAAGPIRSLSPLGASATWPEADSDDNGDSAVVWEQDGHVVGRRVGAGGGLVGPVRRLSASAPAANPVVAVGPGGMALAAWSEIRNGNWYTVVRRLMTNGTAGRAISLGGGSAEKPGVGVDRKGRFVVAWVRGNSAVAAKRINPNSMSATRVLTGPIARSAGFAMVRVGVDRDGDAVVSFRSGGGARPQVWVSRWQHDKAPGKPLRISLAGDSVGFHHALATDLEGDSMIVWTRYNADNRIAMVGRRISRTGVRGPIAKLGLHDRPDIALDDDGDGMLVFHSPSPPADADRVGARVIARSGRFGPTRTVSSNGRVPQVDTRPGARFTLIWQQESYPYSIFSKQGP